MGRKDLLLLALIILINIGLKLPGLGHSSFDLDEAVHLWNAQKPLADIIARAANDPNPPLYNILISFWIQLFGVDEAPARWFSLLFSAFAAGGLFVFLRRNFGLRPALVAVAFFTLSAVQLKFAHNARPYTLMVFFMVCSYGLMLEALRRPTIGVLSGYALATALMLYAHPTSVFNLPAQGLFLLLHLKRGPAHAIRSAVALVVAFGAYVVWYLSIPYFEQENGTWLAPPTLPDAEVAIGQLLVSTDLHLFWLMVAVSVAAVALIIRFKEWDNGRLVVLGLLWTVVPFLGNFAFSHISAPIFQAKYVLSAQVGMTVLLAASLETFRWPWLRYGTIGALVAMMAGLLDWKVTSGEDWRAASAIVKADEGTRTATFISPWYQFQTFAYHYDRDLYRDPSITQPALAERRVFVTWSDIVEQGSGRPYFKRVHFIESQGGVLPQGTVLDSLRNHAILVDEHHLEGINIYTFDLRIPPPVMHLGFDDLPDGTEVLEGDREFSSVILFPMDLTFATDTTVFLSARVRSEGGLDQVFLSAAFINDGNYVANVQAGIGPSLISSNAWQTIRTEMRYERGRHGTSDLKAFVWNPSKRRVEVDELTVTTVRP
jgi:hypothetical protein